jgi:hypothetical protein
MHAAATTPASIAPPSGLRTNGSLVCRFDSDAGASIRVRGAWHPLREAESIESSEIESRMDKAPSTGKLGTDQRAESCHRGMLTGGWTDFFGSPDYFANLNSHINGDILILSGPIKRTAAATEPRQAESFMLVCACRF